MLPPSQTTMRWDNFNAPSSVTIRSTYFPVANRLSVPSRMMRITKNALSLSSDPPSAARIAGAPMTWR